MLYLPPQPIGILLKVGAPPRLYKEAVANIVSEVSDSSESEEEEPEEGPEEEPEEEPEEDPEEELRGSSGKQRASPRGVSPQPPTPPMGEPEPPPGTTVPPAADPRMADEFGGSSCKVRVSPRRAAAPQPPSPMVSDTESEHDIQSEDRPTERKLSEDMDEEANTLSDTEFDRETVKLKKKPFVPPPPRRRPPVARASIGTDTNGLSRQIHHKQVAHLPRLPLLPNQRPRGRRQG